MVVRPSVAGQWSVVGPSLVAVLAVLPLLIPELWAGFRVGPADAVRSVLSPSEQPLSVRSPDGLWAIGLALAWFGLAYRRRNFALWEAALVLIGGSAALARLGNEWIDAATLVAPLARQLWIANFRGQVLIGLAAACVVVGLIIGAISRPPDLPSGASQAALSAAARGAVLADWRWAGELRQRLGPDRQVLPSGGLASESSDFWLDYLRVSQGHERWTEVLRQLNVDLVVLDAAAQQRQAADLVRTSADWRVTFDAYGVVVAERVTS